MTHAAASEEVEVGDCQDDPIRHVLGDARALVALVRRDEGGAAGNSGRTESRGSPLDRKTGYMTSRERRCNACRTFASPADKLNYDRVRSTQLTVSCGLLGSKFL